MYLKSEAKGVLEATLWQPAAKRSLAPFESELAGTSRLLSLVTPSSGLALPGPNASALPRLLLPGHLVPQIVQAQKAVSPKIPKNHTPIRVKTRSRVRDLRKMKALGCGNRFGAEGRYEE